MRWRLRERFRPESSSCIKAWWKRRDYRRQSSMRRAPIDCAGFCRVGWAGRPWISTKMGLVMPAAGVLAKRSGDARNRSGTDLTVGRRLRLLRRSRKRSLQDLATATGLSIGLISQIERGLSSPSVKTLVALGVAIAWFFDETAPLDSSETSLVVRRERRASLAMGEGAVVKELLSPDQT